MEESLKARLIGAAVLVAIAVLLIPELLSGRKASEPVAEEGAGQRGTRTFNIELSGGAGQSVRPAPATASSAANASGPPQKMSSQAPLAEPAPNPEPKPQDRPAAPRPETATASVEPQPSLPPASTAPASAPQASRPAPTQAQLSGGWAVQVGAFGSAESARGLVKDLTSAGYRAYIAPIVRGGKTLHRVRVGPEGDKAAAEQLARRLKARDLPATVVQND